MEIFRKELKRFPKGLSIFLEGLEFTKYMEYDASSR